MGDRAGYEQLGDGYTDRHSTFGADSPPSYQSIAQPLYQSYGQQSYQNQTVTVVSTSTSMTQTDTADRDAQLSEPPENIIAYTLITFCCCWLLGIFAIYFANKANILARHGDDEGAKKASVIAHRLLIASVTLGLLFIALSLFTVLWLKFHVEYY
ncbi:transmembrane protein 91-like isoform X2 [Ruditapes philippinarum]|uniref:transmembrane protein 91-like isoform X2 n=1 Tax=Ruditapes philippinarum TaxID=129788 RepID=UPI00295B6A9D|nr:transmembrane protein 91-like isoform X2 [Ruditapes philippinarum]